MTTRRAILRGAHRFGLVAGTAAALAAVTAALTPALLFAQEEHAEGGGGLFSVNPGLSVWTVVIFVGLLVILRKWAFGPILGAAEEREARIQASLDEAAKLKADAQALLDQHRQQMAEARREAQQIVAQAKEAGEKVRKEIETKARDEGQQILEGARREIEREKESALDEVRREAVDLALAAAAKLIQERLDEPKDRELVSGYLNRLSGETSPRADA